MKTNKQIVNKFGDLVSEFKKERSKKCFENVGDKYINKFNDFIGDYYEYEYFTREAIEKFRKELFDLVTS